MTDERPVAAVDVAELARNGEATGPIWTKQSEDLNVNLLVLAGDDAIASHVNAEVDVLLVGVAGAGVVEVDCIECSVGPGQVLMIPKGARRAIRSAGDRFAYLTCHRRRAGLWPRGIARPGERPAHPNWGDSRERGRDIYLPEAAGIPFGKRKPARSRRSQEAVPVTLMEAKENVR